MDIYIYIYVAKPRKICTANGQLGPGCARKPRGYTWPRKPGSQFKLCIGGFSICFLFPLSPGDPGEGPDCHFPKEFGGFVPIPVRIRREIYF